MAAGYDDIGCQRSYAYEVDRLINKLLTMRSKSDTSADGRSSSDEKTRYYLRALMMDLENNRRGLYQHYI